LNGQVERIVPFDIFNEAGEEFEKLSIGVQYRSRLAAKEAVDDVVEDSSNIHSDSHGDEGG